MTPLRSRGCAQGLPLVLVLVLLLLVGVGCKRGRFSAGHPLDSTTVVGWEVASEESLRVTLEFRDDAPGYGCGVEAFSDDGKSIGYLSARPKDQESRVMTMRLDRGEADEVEDVRVTDCDA